MGVVSFGMSFLSFSGGGISIWWVHHDVTGRSKVCCYWGEALFQCPYTPETTGLEPTTRTIGRVLDVEVEMEPQLFVQQGKGEGTET